MTSASIQCCLFSGVEGRCGSSALPKDAVNLKAHEIEIET